MYGFSARRSTGVDWLSFENKDADMGYWDTTDRILNVGGGHGPACPNCGREMSPADDHGRFICACHGGLSFFDAVLGVPLSTPRIPQVDTAGMADAKKEQIPAINRLHSPPTEREKKALEELQKLHGIDWMEGDVDK
jgi:hypothetical protein